MSNIEKIRQEIERRRDFFYERFLKKGIGCVEESRYDECVEILSFIDSLPDCTVYTKGNGRVKDEVFDALLEEPVSDDLEKAAEEYAYRGVSKEMKPLVKPVADEIIKVFKAGAEWQKQQMISALKNGGELPIEFYDKLHEVDQAAFQNGKKNMKEQILKDAVEGVVCYGSKGAYIETDFLEEYDTEVYGNSGDKVKLIIVKES